MTASERKKQYKGFRVLTCMIREWCGKDAIIGNCRMLAVNDKNYAYNQKFFSRNLFKWQHLDTNTVCLFSKLFLSVCKIVTFSARWS